MNRNDNSNNLFKELLNSQSISRNESNQLKTILVFSKIRKKTQNIALADSPYLRLVELLHLFSINMHDFFREYLNSFYSIDEMDNDIDINILEIQKRFIYDIVRYSSNHKSLEKYFSVFTTLLDIREDIDYTPNEKINSYIKKLAEDIAQRDDNKLIFDYNCYKNFFDNFFKNTNTLLELSLPEDPLSYHITRFHLSDLGISFFRDDFINDLHSDYMKKSYPTFYNQNYETKVILMETIEKYCNYKAPKNKSHTNYTVDFLDIFASFRENWTIIHNLTNNKALSDYLFNYIITSPLTNERIRSIIEVYLKNESPLDIVKRSITYSYLLNYISVQHTRVKPNVIISFFESKCETDEINTVIFCLSNLSYLASMSKDDLEILFYYACTLK